MRIRLALATMALAGALTTTGLGRPAGAVDSDVVACQGSLTSESRPDPVDVSGSGPGTCVRTDGASAPVTTTVSVTASEPSCMTWSASVRLTLGADAYTFIYFGDGASNSGAAVQVSATKNGVTFSGSQLVPQPVPDVAPVPDPAGWLAWSDQQWLTAQACAGLGFIPGVAQPIRFAFTGHFLNPAIH
jgi:hypothetical protein